MKASTSTVEAARAVLGGQQGIAASQEDLYRDLHAHPELGNHETRTASKAAALLREWGYETHDRIGSTGVVGMLRNGPGPVVLVRADMDALPVKEESGVPYASTQTATDENGAEVALSHACGHDVHVSALLGAARLFAESSDRWAGTLIALFQPAEEIASGAQIMLDGGLADLIPTPTVALAQHVLPIPSGTVGTRVGPVLTSADNLRITVFGRGGHGSAPNLTVDPVVLAAMIVVRLQTVVSRIVPPGELAVVTIGRLEAGSKSNIISDRATLELNIRTYSDATRQTIVDGIERIVRAECAASASPKPPTFEYYEHYPVTVNDAGVTATVAAAFSEYFGPAATELAQQTASEDFSEIPDALGVPYSYWGVGGADPEAYARAKAAGTIEQDIASNHSPRFAPPIEPTLRTATAAIVVAATAWLAA
ncbi:amidohydrolase [Microbacterium sp. STN6]|uniref:amidohydrolase n=1 Tax=Microbacterium sp. STN6 TaxID=2995588 RepID=UPI002260F48B|nr:amidohydrolase [Microbacterium sp. STN6]MCX7521392.1 amidohydrolase [Microbacterium sp. STN6]